MLHDVGNNCDVDVDHRKNTKHCDDEPCVSCLPAYYYHYYYYYYCLLLSTVTLYHMCLQCISCSEEPGVGV